MVKIKKLYKLSVSRINSRLCCAIDTDVSRHLDMLHTLSVERIHAKLIRMPRGGNLNLQTNS